MSLLTGLRVSSCRETTVVTRPSPSAKRARFKSGREKSHHVAPRGWRDSVWRKRCAGKIGDVAGDGRWSGTSYGEYDKSRENFDSLSG